MKVWVYSFDKFIGTTELKVGDEGMGHLYGEFIPTEAYYAEVQPHVWNICDTKISNNNRWELLVLTAKDAHGIVIDATGGITLFDLEEMPDEPKQFDIAGVDLKALGLNNQLM